MSGPVDAPLGSLWGTGNNGTPGVLATTNHEPGEQWNLD